MTRFQKLLADAQGEANLVAAALHEVSPAVQMSQPTRKSVARGSDAMLALNKHLYELAIESQQITRPGVDSVSGTQSRVCDGCAILYPGGTDSDSEPALACGYCGKPTKQLTTATPSQQSPPPAWFGSVLQTARITDWLTGKLTSALTAMGMDFAKIGTRRVAVADLVAVLVPILLHEDAQEQVTKPTPKTTTAENAAATARLWLKAPLPTTGTGVRDLYDAAQQLATRVLAELATEKLVQPLGQPHHRGQIMAAVRKAIAWLEGGPNDDGYRSQRISASVMLRSLLPPFTTPCPDCQQIDQGQVGVCPCKTCGLPTTNCDATKTNKGPVICKGCGSELYNAAAKAGWCADCQPATAQAAATAETHAAAVAAIRTIESEAAAEAEKPRTGVASSPFVQMACCRSTFEVGDLLQPWDEDHTRVVRTADRGKATAVVVRREAKEVEAVYASYLPGNKPMADVGCYIPEAVRSALDTQHPVQVGGTALPICKSCGKEVGATHNRDCPSSSEGRLVLPRHCKPHPASAVGSYDGPRVETSVYPPGARITGPFEPGERLGWVTAGPDGKPQGTSLVWLGGHSDDPHDGRNWVTVDMFERVRKVCDREGIAPPPLQPPKMKIKVDMDYLHYARLLADQTAKEIAASVDRLTERIEQYLPKKGG